MGELDEKICQLAADILGVPPDEITLDSSPETIASWDSLQHLNLVLGVEEELGMAFTPEDIEGVRCVGDLISLARDRKPAST